MLFTDCDLVQGASGTLTRLSCPLTQKPGQTYRAVVYIEATATSISAVARASQRNHGFFGSSRLETHRVMRSTLESGTNECETAAIVLQERLFCLQLLRMGCGKAWTSRFPCLSHWRRDIAEHMAEREFQSFNY